MTVEYILVYWGIFIPCNCNLSICYTYKMLELMQDFLFW